jgi:protein SCO1/2
MRAAAAIAAAMLLFGATAQARLSQATLDAASATPNPTAPLPLDVHFKDTNGARRTLGNVIRTAPTLLIFADYTCRNLCGPMVAFGAAGLQRAKLRPGTDFQFVVIGIDARDGVDDALRMKSTYFTIGSPLAAATTFLTGDTAAIEAATAAADYHFIYDSEQDQFAHPAVAFVLRPDGTFVRVLSVIGIGGDDLRLALIDSGNGHVGSLADRIRLLCYGFDPAKGIYTLAITRWLAAGGIVTCVMLAASIGLLLRRNASERSL